MFDSADGDEAVVAPAAPPAPLSNEQLDAFRAALALPAAVDPAGGAPSAADRLGRIRVLEQLRAAVAAAQAVETAAYLTAARVAARVDVATRPVPGVGTRRRLAEADRVAIGQLAAARRESPSQTSRWAAFAETAPSDYPALFGRLAAGEVSERRARTVHTVTAWLPPVQRRMVDAELAPRLDGWGDARVEREARTAAYRLAPGGACARVAAAEADRCTTLRPAPEAMTWFGARLPLVQGVAVHATLLRAARDAKARGDARSRGQVMADTLVERVTGQTTADAVPVAIQLVMTDQALLGPKPGETALTDLLADHTLPGIDTPDPADVADPGDVADAAGPARTDADPAYIAEAAGTTDTAGPAGPARAGGPGPGVGETREGPTHEAMAGRRAPGETAHTGPLNDHTLPPINTADRADTTDSADTAGTPAEKPTTGGSANGSRPATAPPGQVPRWIRVARAGRGGADEPARLPGHGPLPAPLARRLLLHPPASGSPAARTVRRLFTDPAGRLVAAETRSRVFTPAMAALIAIRDDTCRTPWCNAPIAHTDHHTPHATGGPTTLTNGRGLCARCNLTQTPTGTGERAAGRPDTTPPDLPGTPRPAPPPTRLARHLDIIWTGTGHAA